jgi:hypothetical protein
LEISNTFAHYRTVGFSIKRRPDTAGVEGWKDVCAETTPGAYN